MAEREPIFNLPRAVLVASLVMIAVQVVMDLLPDEISIRVLLTLAFIPARYSGAAAELPGGYITAVTSFVTYMVVHGGWTHLLINVMWMLAFGTAVARRIGNRGFYEFSILCGIAGVLTHLALHWGAIAPVVGASAAISGQMAGALRFIFFAKPRPGESKPDFFGVPLASLGQTFSDRRIVAFMLFWLVLNVYFGVTSFGIDGSDGGVAWEAHIGGFVCGLLIFGFFDRRSRSDETLAAS